MNESKEHMMQEFIIKHSETIFLKNGYQGTSMDMIAESCQISKPTLYKYFPSKYELFMSLSLQVEHEIYHYMTNLVEKKERKIKTLESIIDYMFEVSEKKGVFFRMMIREHHMIVHQNIEEHIQWFMKSRMELIEVIARFIEDWIDPQIKKDVGLEVVAATLYNIFSGMMTDMLFTDLIDRKSYKKFIVRFLKNGLMKEK